MNDPVREHDHLAAIASDVTLTIAGTPGLHEMLTAIARRTAEALDVWECDLYEFLPESDEFAAVALWAREMRRCRLRLGRQGLPGRQPALLPSPLRRTGAPSSSRSTIPPWVVRSALSWSSGASAAS